MTEKYVETALSNCLAIFNQSSIYFSPTENPTLKNIFKKASKTGPGAGCPDRIYYDGTILIVFECKKKKLQNAKKDLQVYKSKMLPCDGLQIYYVAFVKDNYEIYDSEFRTLNVKLIPQSFGVKAKEMTTYTPQNMLKDMHNLHNYIRDYTKISNEDKSFFVACILISLKKESFCKLLENYDSKLYIYDLISQNLTDFDIDVSVFEFLRNDENNVHFLNIIKMIKNIYEKQPGTDLLNRFYSEFVKYSNTDGKSLGIVLTPEHIVSLMVKMLDVEPQDTFLDFCAGTGSFLLEALNYNPSHVVACEYQTKLYNLLKCNMILRNVAAQSSQIVRGDCFEYEFKADKSAINPPYGMKDKRELDFVLKQIESIKDGGLLCAIVPCSCLANSQSRNMLFDRAVVRKVVICNNDLFYPNAGVKTCIILMEKRTHGFLKQKIVLDNFECDGFEIKRNQGRVYVGGEKHELMSVEISKTDETWLHYKIERVVDRSRLQLKLLEVDYNTKRLLHLASGSGPPAESKREGGTFKSFKIVDLFHILKKPKIKYNVGAEAKSAVIYEISAKNNNNGIKGVGRANDNTFSGNKIVLVTGGNGGAGMAYYQEVDFNISSATVVLEPKEDFHMDKLVGIYVAEELSKYKGKYSRGFQWNLSRIQNDTLDLPVVESSIDYDYIHRLFE